MYRERTKLEFGTETEIWQTTSERLPSTLCRAEIDQTRVSHAVDATKAASSDRPLEDRFERRPEFSPAGRASFLRKDASSGQPLGPMSGENLGKSVHAGSDPTGRATPKRLRLRLLGRLGRPERTELEFGPRPEN